MPAPDVTVEISDAPPARSGSIDTDTLFITGEFDRGTPGVAYEIKSPEAMKKLGKRTTISQLAWDSVDFYQQEGGARLFASRVVGDSPVKATAKIFDQAGSTDPADVALIAVAAEVGEWGNKLNVVIDDHTSISAIPSGSFRVTVTHDDDGTLEQSPDLLDRTAAVAWAASSADYLDSFTLGASNEDPRAQSAISFAGGTADRGTIDDTNWQAAEDAFDEELGCGQVVAVGRTTPAGHSQVLAQWEKNRVGLPDAIDTPTAATVAAQATAVEDGPDAVGSALFGPWAVIPGLAPGTTRQVPFSVGVAGIIARNDRKGLPVNEAPAGKNGVFRYAIGATQAYSKSDRDLLADAQVNVVRQPPGQPVMVMDLQTVADPDGFPLWTQFQNSRLIMYARAKAKQIGSRFLFEQIDGQGLVFERLASDLKAELCKPLFDQGSLYGATEDDAYRIDVGDQVNTEDTIQAGRILAQVGLKVSPGARFVTIQLARTAINQPV